MQIREERDEESNESTTHCVPDKLNGWSAAVTHMWGRDSHSWWYVHLGKLGRDTISIDDDMWPEFVAFVNELDVLVKEKTNA